MSHNLIPLKRCLIALLSLIPLLAFQVNGCEIRGTGDLGIVIERASGSIQVINTSQRESLGRIEGLGDLSHASAVFSRDGRYAYIFGRDGGLSKIDLLCNNIVKRVIQGGNSIGGAISQNGRWVAVSNYEPGGVRIFNSDSLELVADIPATALSKEKYSRTVGLVDAPGNRFIYSLFDTGETWVVEMDEEKPPTIQKFTDIGIQPYDGLITPDGRTYIAGLFGEDGLTLCRNLRSESNIPVIMLTAMGEETDRIIGLEMGADDYLAKPFNPRELLARIKAVLRRSADRPTRKSQSDEEQKMTRYVFSGWALEVERRELFSPSGALVPLSGGEFELLLAFITHPGRVMNRDQLLDLARGREAQPFDRSIDVQVSRLRRKIEDDPKNPSLIKTVRSGGYLFASEVSQ